MMMVEATKAMATSQEFCKATVASVSCLPSLPSSVTTRPPSTRSIAMLLESAKAVNVDEMMYAVYPAQTAEINKTMATTATKFRSLALRSLPIFLRSYSTDLGVDPVLDVLDSPSCHFWGRKAGQSYDRQPKG